MSNNTPLVAYLIKYTIHVFEKQNHYHAPSYSTLVSEANFGSSLKELCLYPLMMIGVLDSPKIDNYK